MALAMLIIYWGFSLFSARAKAVKPGTYIEVSLPSDISESPYMYVQDWEIQRQTDFFSVLDAIEYAATDKKVAGLILDMDSLSLPAQQIGELRVSVEKFKESGKKVYAAGDGADASSYRAALLADKIVMTPSQAASFSIPGYYASYPYYKTFFDKAGIKCSVLSTGEYKTYGETYERDAMSEGMRQQVSTLLESRYASLVEDIASSRNIEKERVVQMIDSGELSFISPVEAREKGLIDETMHYERFLRTLSKKDGEKPPLRDISEYAALPNVSKSKASGKDSIAIIFAEGSIYMDDVNPSIIRKESVITPDVICGQLESATDDEDIKGIVIRVNSPGGSALASEIIYDAIGRAREKKPVYVSMGPVAASGGYYISCQADRIFAGRETLTGSIGVVSVIPTFEGIYEKLGVNVERLQRGKYSGTLDLSKGLSADEEALLQKSIENVYAEFKQRVSSGRNMDMEKLEGYAQGRVWTGDKAVEIGLADEVGNLGDAIEAMAKKTGLGSSDVTLVESGKKSMTMARVLRDNIARAQLEHLQIAGPIEDILIECQKLLEIREEPLMLMPYELD
ncbi:protease 4 [Peptoclostridium acidaminophilum DSM 3953]|uniref:Protease 4 n=2 Tax=Peptoclostridium acidaminophilum TaxID=1731 RepID=W8U929_PEPAC|nr:protease 4 [Peptoclostridium acidaminophilum DSM 3953]